MKKLFLLAVIILGASGIVGQIICLREFLIIFLGNELSIGVILANWLVLQAAGAFFGKHIEKIKNINRKKEAFVILQVIFSLILIATIYLIRVLKNIIGVSPVEAVGLFSIFYLSFFILLPICFIHGALFTISCQIYSLLNGKEAAAVGKIYIYELLGTAIGGIVTTYFFVPYFNSFQIASGFAVLNFFVCLFLVSLKILFCLLLGGIIFISSLLLSSRINQLHWHSINNQWKNQKVIHYQNSIYGNITVIKSYNQTTFFFNGLPIITLPIGDKSFIEEIAHFSLLFSKQPKNILIISGGVGGIINEMLKHNPQTIDYVELDPLILKLIKKFPATLTLYELNNPKVNIEFIDGRFFIKTIKKKYDVILVNFSNPQDLQINRLFTYEFFCAAKEKLNKEGILVISSPGSLVFLNEELKSLNACVLNTLKSVFGYVRVIPGDGLNLYLASCSKTVALLSSAEIISRFKERDLKTSLITPQYIEYKLHSRWQKRFFLLIKDANYKINKDFLPIGVFYSMRHWSAMFSPITNKIYTWFERANIMNLVFLLVILFATIIVLTKGMNLVKLSIPFAIATTGFAGMVWYIILIFTFQVLYGYVYYWIGLLISFFMTGLIIGAALIVPYLEKIKNKINLLLKIELSIIIFSCIIGVVLYLLKPLFVPFILKINFIVLLIISGVLVGIEFPLANKICLEKEEKLSSVAGLLYASDLLGAWVGSVAASLLLLPILGIFTSCAAIIFLKLGSFCILFFMKQKLS